MDVRSSLHDALQNALSRVLRSLFRVLLRHAVSYTAFEALARRIYVEVAMDEFAIEGKKPSISRASILSGLTRKEVRRLIAEPQLVDNPVAGERYNRAARVLTGWVRDPDFAAADGEPRPLALEGPGGFAALVRRHSGDMPARAVLDELLRVGAVRWQDGQHVALQTRAYVPVRSAPDKLEILGTDVSQLIATIDHNIEHGDGDPRFQRKVMYAGIAHSALPAFRKLSAGQAQALLERLDAWLQAHGSPPATPAGPGEKRTRVGMGIYYIEEPEAPQSTEKHDEIS